MPHTIRRAFSFALALLLPTLTTGCAAFNNSLNAAIASLFGSPARPVTAPAPPPSPQPRFADEIVVLKDKRVLELKSHGKIFESFPIALGAHSRGPKRRQGDGRTPEGVYRIDGRSMRTRWTRELHISYPDENDRARAEAEHVDPGGAIYIHGMPADYGPYDPPLWVKDWTEGCIAVGNAAIVKIWDAVPDGTPINILP
jgi:murein L,D-transpeptidase YafK